MTEMVPALCRPAVQTLSRLLWYALPSSLSPAHAHLKPSQVERLSLQSSPKASFQPLWLCT